jgi:hypothetical protein
VSVEADAIGVVLSRGNNQSCESLRNMRPMMSEADPYLLGYRQVEQDRLQRQAHQFGGESSWLFDQMGVTSGVRFVEIGCGPSGRLGILSDLVGPLGSVVGVEQTVTRLNAPAS